MTELTVVSLHAVARTLKKHKHTSLEWGGEARLTAYVLQRPRTAPYFRVSECSSSLPPPIRPSCHGGGPEGGLVCPWAHAEPSEITKSNQNARTIVCNLRRTHIQHPPLRAPRRHLMELTEPTYGELTENLRRTYEESYGGTYGETYGTYG